MGKPVVQPQAYRDDPDAVSLHSTPAPDYDDVAQIEPPAYTDDMAQAGPSAPFNILNATQRVEISESHSEFLGKPINVVKGVQNFIEPRCDDDPAYLEQYIKQLSGLAPNPTIHIVGTHRETRRRNNKSETEQVVDFRITFNMTDYLFPSTGLADWRPDLHTVENGEKAHRGGIMASRAPGYKADLEVGDAKPSLTEWCHRYCASGTFLKVFRLTRQVTGFDEAHLKSRLEGIIRGTGYRGNISVTFPVGNQFVDIYSNNQINQWRLTTWIRWMFYLTFLWLLTWPYLFATTKRYAIVKAEWPFSKVDAAGHKQYATCSEEQWLQRFYLAIQQLVLDRYQGDASQEYLGQILTRPEIQSRRTGDVHSGHAGVDAAVGLFQNGLRAANNVNRLLRFGDAGPQEGWGYDT